MAQSSPEGIILGKGSTLIKMEVSVSEKNKQETLEEAAERLFPTNTNDEVVNYQNKVRKPNWIQGAKPQLEKTSESHWKQTLKTVPIAVISFSLGLNSHHLILAAKIVASAVIVGAGAFALGTTVRG